MTTARDIVTAALRKIGVGFNGTSISASEMQDGLDCLNTLIESLANDSLMVYARTWETFNLVSGQVEYTMGTGGDFNTARPSFIVSSYIRDGVTDYPLSIIPDEMYVNYITQKDTQGIPAYINSDNGSPLVKLRLYPVPTNIYQIFILSEKPATNLGLDDEIVMPQGWKRMLIYNLAVDVGPEYGVPIDPMVMQIAQESKRLVRASVMRNRTMDSNPVRIIGGRFENGWMV